MRVLPHAGTSNSNPADEKTKCGSITPPRQSRGCEWRPSPTDWPTRPGTGSPSPSPGLRYVKSVRGYFVDVRYTEPHFPQVELVIDCHPVYRRALTRPLDTNFTSPQLSLWLGQRNSRHSLFKVYFLVIFDKYSWSTNPLLK